MTGPLLVPVLREPREGSFSLPLATNLMPNGLFVLELLVGHSWSYALWRLPAIWMTLVGNFIFWCYCFVLIWFWINFLEVRFIYNKMHP